MEADFMRKSLLLLILISFNIQAAVKVTAADELSRHRTQVMQMGARLSSLEKEIGAKNNLYLSSIEQIKQFEADIKLYKDHLNEIQKQVKVSQEENKKILKSYLLGSENESTELWQRKVHLELLKQAQMKLKDRETQLANFEAKVNEFDKKLSSLKQDEEELAKVIDELESRKKIAMEKYLEQLEKKKKVEKIVSTQKVKKRLAQVKKTFNRTPVVQKRPDRIFPNPLEDFMTYTASPKGVTFKYSSIQPVKAVGSGKVVYAGDLSNYGQVVLIDHGNDLRTVLLGKMNVKVKKNDVVKNGDILAYTQNNSKEAQNLYFEVRKKNTAQNTILWLETNGVSKI
jgi:septal ring factor EnvC (AmiA/AmiB activator)